MPNNPNNWVEALHQIPADLAGALLAMFTSAIRVIYDKNETRTVRVVLESLICGGLSLTASSAIVAMGMNIDWAIFVGGTIGSIGSLTVRAIALKLINKHVDK